MEEQNTTDAATPAVNTPSQPTAKKSPVCLILAIVFFVIFVILCLAGYLLFKNGASSIKNFATKVTLNSSCKYNDPDLCKFLNNWQTVKYYTANSTSTFEGKPQQTIMKSVGTDKFQMTSLAGGTENFNMISIGNTTYTKDYTDNKWLKTVNKEESEVAKTTRDEFDYNVTEDKTEYKKIGEEACGKLTCFKYQVVDPTAQDLNSKEYIVFDNKEYKLRKAITEGPDNNSAVIEFDYSKISIDEPSPVKETSTSTINTNQPKTQSGSSANNSSYEQAIKDAEEQLQDLGVTDQTTVDESTPLPEQTEVVGPPVPGAPE